MSIILAIIIAIVFNLVVWTFVIMSYCFSERMEKIICAFSFMISVPFITAIVVKAEIFGKEWWIWFIILGSGVIAGLMEYHKAEHKYD